MLKIGDKVAVYGFDHTGMLHNGIKGVVKYVDPNGLVKVDFLSIFYFYIHAKQCRKLTKKTVAVPLSIGDTVMYEGYKLVVCDVGDVFITACTPAGSEEEPSYYTDTKDKFFKLK